jgi:hypothetical protein
MFVSSSDSNKSKTRHHDSHVVSHAPKDRNASHGPSILFRTFDASYIIHCKNDRIVAKNVVPKCKKGKTYTWVPKSYITNQNPKPKYLAGLCIQGLKLDH